MVGAVVGQSQQMRGRREVISTLIRDFARDFVARRDAVNLLPLPQKRDFRRQSRLVYIHWKLRRDEVAAEPREVTVHAMD